MSQRLCKRLRGPRAASHLLWLACLAPPILAAEGPADPAIAQATQLASQAAASGAPPGTRVEVLTGTLDPRLRLAPCARVEAFLPPGSLPWGRTRVGLRCLQGETRWSVTLPITVKVWAPGMVAAAALPAGTLLTAQHLQRTEIDWAEASAPAYADGTALLGRMLGRPLAAGSAVRRTDIKARQWFAAGDTVRVVASGEGFSLSSDGQALSNGVEGQPARVRLEAGRVVTGQPTGERRMELAL